MKAATCSLWARPGMPRAARRTIIAVPVLAAGVCVRAAVSPGKALKLPADGQDFGIEIGVWPSQSKGLALAQPKSEGDVPSGAVAACHGQPDYPQRFFEVQRLDLALAGRWGVHQAGDVPGDVSALHGDFEGARQYAVNLEHCCRRQAFGFEPGVEALNVFRAEAVQAVLAQPGDDPVTDRDGVIVVRARTAGGPVPCPRCGSLTGQVHGYHDRTVADVPADGRPVVVQVRVRRMRCPALDCRVQTFREQVPGLLDRYQRRTTRLAGQAGEAVRRLAGRAGAGLLAALGIPLSRHTALRLLLRLPLPEVAVPRVLGVDDFALRRGQVYATILIDAQTGQRVDVLASRKADALETWLRSHPGVEIVCRDGSGAYGEAVRRALPGAVQAGDRWHLWHGLGEAVLKEVAAHTACWAATGPPLNQGRQAQTTAERWRQVHDLTDRGTGLLECSRRLGLSLNTVKRYARAAKPERMIRAPRYRATLVDPYRDHLRARRDADPAVPVHQLLAEIREQGYPGTMNLLYRYITQGRVEADQPHLSPRRVARMLLTRPDALSDSQQALLSKLTGACPEMTSLAGLVHAFAAMLKPGPANEAKLKDWADTTRACDLPSLHAFTRGLDLDAQAVIAAVTLPFHNGRTEGVNTKTKMIKRQMYGRAGFTLLRHRILLG
jgi:transposase